MKEGILGVGDGRVVCMLVNWNIQVTLRPGRAFAINGLGELQSSEIVWRE